MPRACCSARTSVGAMKAPWCPPCTAASSVQTATTVLPAPTSPCSSRCIGCGPARSLPDLGDGRALVGGELERQAVEERVEQRALGRRGRCPRVVRSMCRLRWTSASWTRSSSSSTSRRRATSLCGHRLGGVDAGERLGPGHQVVAVEHPVGHGIGQTPAGRPPQGLGHPVADLPGGQARLLGLRVDGHDAPGAVADEVDDRVGHLLAPAEQLDLAEAAPRCGPRRAGARATPG